MAEPVIDIDQALGLCTYCPSLCRHTCPVATAEGSDTIAPWGMMSLAGHVRAGRVKPTPDVMAVIGACNGCGACTAYCHYDNPVLDTLVAVRAEVKRDHGVLSRPAQRPGWGDAGEPATTAFYDGLAARSREDRPAVSLVPGRGAVPDAVERLLSLCDRLDVDGLACGELARLDLGYDAWLAGDHETFMRLAKAAHAAAGGARDLVVMSAEALFLLKVIYPRFGLSIGAALLHVSEMLLPLLSGAVVKRLPGRIGYHESCHLGRQLEIRDVPRQVLRRVLEGPLRELPERSDITGCCGGSGRCGAREDTTERMADDVLAAAAEVGFDRLTSFSTECVEALRAAEQRRVGRGLASPRVDHAVALIAEAVIGDGAAA